MAKVHVLAGLALAGICLACGACGTVGVLPSTPPYDPAGLIGCGGQTIDPAYLFPQSKLSEPAPPEAELANDPAGVALLAFVHGRGASIYRRAQSGWKQLTRTSTKALFGQGATSIEWQATMENGPGGWKWTGGGGCSPSHPGTTTFSYTVDPADPSTLDITYATGSCGSESPDPIDQLYVKADGDAVVIAVHLDHITPAGGCGGVGRIGKTTVRLKSPLESRTVFDGGPVPMVRAPKPLTAV